MEARQSLFKRIETQVKKVIPQAKVVMFGSTATCLALRGSDVDILVYESDMKMAKLLELVQNRLLKVKAFEYVEAISA